MSGSNSSAIKRFWARLSILLPLVAASIPPLLISATVLRYGLNVPYWDEWSLVDYLDAGHAGQLGFKSLLTQHNEHRILLPRALLLALARVTDWDIRYELWANIVVALGSLGMLALLLKLTVQSVKPLLVPWLILAASLTTFSLAQWDNWLWGIQIQVFMSTLAAVVTVWALARWGAQWLGLAVGLLAAIAGAFSFASGLILLLLIPLCVLVAPQFHEGTHRLKHLAVAVAFGAGLITLYLIGFRYPPHHPTPFYLFSHPLSYGYYILIYLGAPLGIWSASVSAWWGGIGIVSFAWCGAWLWRRSPAHRHALLPWIMLGLYAILSGCMTAVGRVGFGTDQALAARYITISSLFWVSVDVIAAMAITRLLEDTTASRTRSLTVIAVTSSLITLGGVSYGASWTHAKAAIEGHHAALLRGRECLLYYDRAPDECLRVLYPDAALVRTSARKLERLALGPFARGEQKQPLPWYNLVLGPGPAGYIDGVAVHEATANRTNGTGEVVVSGWAMDPFTRSRAASVLVVVEAQVMGRATTGRERPDVAKALGENRLLRSGWTFRFGLFRLGPGRHLVEAYAVLDDGRRIVRLEGSRVIEVRD